MRLLLFCAATAGVADFLGCSPADPPWQARQSDDNNWLLAVAPLSDKVLAVGGQPGPAPAQPGTGLILAVPDDPAATPARLSSPQPGMLWWVHTLAPLGSPGAGTSVAWLCGENGSVVRYEENGGTPTLQTISTATTATLYGIWAFSDDDVWAVGGNDGSPGVILHGDRSGLGIDSTAPVVPVLFKLFATDADHLFVVGHAGTLLRRSGGVWIMDAYPAPTSDRIVTVFGLNASAIYAVGGLGSGVLLSFDGQHWAMDDAVAGYNPLAGLSVTDSDFLVAGQDGLIARRAGGSGPFQRAPAVTSLDLHGALLRGGARYAVGGNLSQYGLSPPQGVLLQQGLP